MRREALGLQIHLSRLAGALRPLFYRRLAERLFLNDQDARSLVIRHNIFRGWKASHPNNFARTRQNRPTPALQPGDLPLAEKFLQLASPARPGRTITVPGSP